MTASSRFRRLHDAQVGTPLQHPAHLALSHLAASSSSSSRPSDSSPSKEPASDPLYPAYLPTRPEDFSRAEAHPKFEVQEAGLRADAQLPTLTRLLLDVGRAEDITPRIGTEIFGVQLSQLNSAGLDEVALLAAKRGVLVFRDQDFADLGLEKQFQVVRHFGPLHRHPTQGYPKGASPEMQVIYADPKAGTLRDYLGPRTSYELFHNDQTWEEHAPSVSFMWALELPSGGGGDTVFSSLVAAYNALSPAFAATLDGLQLEHSSLPLAKMAQLGPERSREEGVFTVHPLVIRHPVTGEKALYLSPTSAWSVVGFYPSESANLLDFLHRHVQSLDFTCRIKWEPRTVVVWDQASSCSVLAQRLTLPSPTTLATPDATSFGCCLSDLVLHLAGRPRTKPHLEAPDHFCALLSASHSFLDVDARGAMPTHTGRAPHGVGEQGVLNERMEDSVS